MSLLLQSYSLTEAINTLKTPQPYILDSIFKRKVSHPVNRVTLERWTGNDGISKFNTKNGEAHPVGKTGRKFEDFTIPRVYEKKVFEASELAMYELFGNPQVKSTEEATKQANEWVLRELEELKQRQLRLREKTALEALLTGKVVDAEAGVNLDFGYVSNKHKLTLTSGDRWSQTTSKPVENLISWKRAIMLRSGKNANQVFLGKTAASNFRNHAEVQGKLDLNNYRIGQLNFNSDLGSVTMYMGSIAGFEIYEYFQEYTDASNTKQAMMADTQVLLTAPSDSFRQHSGVIETISKDGKLVLTPADMMVKARLSEDEKVIEWTCESFHVPFIHNVDNVMCVTTE